MLNPRVPNLNCCLMKNGKRSMNKREHGYFQIMLLVRGLKYLRKEVTLVQKVTPSFTHPFSSEYSLIMVSFVDETGEISS